MTIEEIALKKVLESTQIDLGLLKKQVHELKAENVELVGACKDILKAVDYVQTVTLREEDTELYNAANKVAQALSSSSSAKWVEAVERLMDTIRELKNNTGEDWDSYWMEVEVAFDYLTNLEKEGNYE